MMIHHGYFRSSSSYRLRIALNLKGLESEYRSVHLLKDGGQQKTPQFAALSNAIYNLMCSPQVPKAEPD